MDGELIIVKNVKKALLKMINNNKTKLVCLTGFMGSGKTTAIEFFKENNIDVFVMDQYIHQIYQYNQIGYLTIKNIFGDEYVNDIEVNRNKLKELILSDESKRELLDYHIGLLMFNKLKELINLDKLIIVELGIYIYRQEYYSPLFNKVVGIKSDRENILDNFKKIHDGYKFSTNRVGNYKNLDISKTIYCDFVVDNNKSIEEFKTNLKKILEYLTDKR